MNGELKHKKILVIGGSSGIGLETVHCLVNEGAVVYASGSRKLEQEPEGYQYYSCDVSDHTQIDALFDRLKEETDILDGFVYSSGIGSSSGFRETTLDHFDQVLSINLRGAYYSASKAVGMMSHSGSIVFVASQKGLCGSTGSLAYNASKGGMIIMSRSMALELGGDGIRVNCVCPGPTDTAMFRKDMNNQPDPEAAWKKVAASNPLGLVTSPDKIAAGILYMLSDKASFVTGTELVIDGGNIAGVRNI